MPSTAGFEVVAQLSEGVLRQTLDGAWDNNLIPHTVDIPAGLAFGPYSVADGVVQIPRERLGLDCAPASNGVKITLGTDVQVEIANPPVPSAEMFEMATRTEVTVPVGTLPGTINVGILLDGIPRSAVAVTLTSGDPIGPLTLALVAEYVHARYMDNTIPHTVTQTGVSLGGITADAFLRIYDDATDPARRISVSAPSAGQVKIVLPSYLQLSNISHPQARSPMAVTAGIAITAPLQVAAGSVTAQLAAATVTVENLAPAPGLEGTNYSLNKAGFPSLDAQLTAQLVARGQALLAAIGNIVVSVPTVAAIEQFIGDRTHEALVGGGDIGVWTPQTGGTPVTVQNVQVKVLADAIAFGINAGGGANANAIVDFIPAGKSCAVAIDGAKVIQIIQDAIHAPEADGGFGANFPPKTFDNIEGRRVRLNSLTPSLINGFIQFRGEVTVFDAIAGSIDVDAGFTAKLVLEWQDEADGSQRLVARLAEEPDIDLSAAAWILSLILGFLTFGVVGVVIVAIVLSLADDLAESVGGKVIRDQVTGRVQTISAWPQSLDGIGSVDSRFENPVTIDPQGIMFPDGYTVTATYALTVDALAEANGPYVVDAGAPITFNGGPSRPDTEYAWDFGDGSPPQTGMTATHAYGDDGVYVAKLTTTVNQPGGVETRHFAEIRARNVAPVVNAGSPITVDEGEEIDYVATFTDQEWLDVHEAWFRFGDDTMPVRGTLTETNDPPQARGQATCRHAYCDDGDYTLVVQVIDDDGGVGEDARPVTVRNVPPTVDAGDDLFVLPRMPVTLAACFTDPGWCDTHVATWDPGDCSELRTAVVQEQHAPPAGTGIAAALHVYERCGTYLASCVVTDDDGGVGSDTLVVRVVELHNPGFESGFRERNEGVVGIGWLPYPQRPVPSKRDAAGSAPYGAEPFVVHSGRRSQRMSGGKRSGVGIRQTIGANPGWDYQVSAWCQLPPRWRGSTVRLGIDPAGGAIANGSEVVWTQAGPSPEWQQLVERVTATGRAITIFIEAEGDEGATAYVDDVELLVEACPLPECQPAGPPDQEGACVDFDGEEPGERDPELERSGYRFTSLDAKPLVIVQAGSPPRTGLRVPERGLQVTLPFVARRVEAEVLPYTTDPVAMTALDVGGQPIGEVHTTGSQQQTLTLAADGATWVLFRGGRNEAVVLSLCVERALPSDASDEPQRPRSGDGLAKGR